MKPKKLILLLSLIAAALLLSGCSGRSTVPSSWPGITVADDVAYVAFNQYVYGVQINNGTQSALMPDKPISATTTFFHDPLMIDETTLIVGDYKKEIHAFNTSSHTTEVFFSDASGRWIAAPLMLDDTIYAPNADNTLYALNLDGSVKWTFETGDPIWAAPMSSEGQLYIASMDRSLYALDADNGNLVWQTELDGTMVNNAYLGDDGVLYIGTFNSEVLALDSETGSIIWRLGTDDWVWGTPILYNGVLYVTDLSGKVYAIDPVEQSILWQYKADGAISGSVLAVEDGLYVASQGGTIYCLNDSGSLRWQASLSEEEGEFAGTPVATENSILIGALQTDSILFAYSYEGTLQWQFTPEN